MRVFGLLFFFLSFHLTAGTQLTTQIQDVDYGQSMKDEILVFLTSGHVAKINPQDKHILDVFAKKTKGNWYEVNMDDERFITGLTEMEAPVQSKGPKFFSSIDNDYVPTTIANMDTAKKYHREARYNPKESQCFNRAHVWSYEWWRDHSLKSNKLLIFFTRTYIRRYNFEWWFHIAPYVHVMHEGKVVERVLDVKYGRGPMEFQKWANLFLRNDAPCPVITKYSDYADHPYSGECFFQRTHMYTYQPADLQMYEAWGYKKTSWNFDELRGAYLEAFDEYF